MKNALKLALCALFLIGAGNTVSAQQVKMGYINSGEIFILMPERDSALVKLEAFTKDWQELLEGVEVEYRQKMNDLSKIANTASETILKQKQNELGEIQARLQNMNEQAEQEYGQKQNELTAPIIEKLQAAIEKIGKANGFTAIFDAAALLYQDQSAMTDIVPLVKKELGIK